MSFVRIVSLEERRGFENNFRKVFRGKFVAPKKIFVSLESRWNFQK